MSTRRGIVLLLALLIDILVGDPPNRYHPTAWMGSAIAQARQRAPQQGQARQFTYGAALATGGTTLVAAVGQVLTRLLRSRPAPIALLGEALALKMTFSWTGLRRAATEVKAALTASDFPEARRRLSWHLVSRETSQLDASQVAAATIESVAENTSDGIVAPLLYYILGGLPAAFAYRFLNTGDAMLGYHDEEREWLGKAPARLDDLANLLPARLSALLLVIAASIVGENGRRAWMIWRRDASKTASPNAGHPMSAMAGALNVELEKVGHYRLGKGQNAAQPADIARSVRVMNTAVLLTGAVFIGLSLIAGLAHRRTKS